MEQYARYQPPIRFVEKVIESQELEARTVVHFPYSPTLSMLAEAGAQTSIFAKLTEQKLSAGIPIDAAGMLLSIKATWHQKTDRETFEVECRYVSNLENFFVMAFSVYDADVLIADGQFSAILEKEGEPF
ncbi:MAG: hypothetical protein DRG24_07380 [Epsilonproteobacteria bacterium]|nr:MAG: hypothetical protein DRG24_07380 [Campylobacterota bacterium]